MQIQLFDPDLKIHQLYFSTIFKNILKINFESFLFFLLGYTIRLATYVVDTKYIIFSIKPDTIATLFFATFCCAEFYDICLILIFLCKMFNFICAGLYEQVAPCVIVCVSTRAAGDAEEAKYGFCHHIEVFKTKIFF